MATMEQMVLALNASGTIAVGAICIFIVSTTLRKIEDQAIHEFTKRLRLVLVVLMVFVGYFSLYRTLWSGGSLTRIPLYFLLVVVFAYIMWAVVSFERMADTHGVSNTDKLERARKQEDA